MAGHLRIIAAIALAVLVSACGPTFQNHGYVPPPEDLNAVLIGVDTRDSVEATIGRPSASGVIGETAWFYMRERRRQFGPLRDRAIDRELVAISFDEAGTVANIERFGLQDGRVVTLSRRVTRTTIREFGLIQQILRNFGRIDVGQELADGA